MRPLHFDSGADSDNPDPFFFFVRINGLGIVVFLEGADLRIIQIFMPFTRPDFGMVQVADFDLISYPNRISDAQSEIKSVI